MIGALLVFLVGVGLAVYGYWPRRDRRTGRPVRRPPGRAVLRLLFDLALIPFQLLVFAFFALGPTFIQISEIRREVPRGGPRRFL